MYCDVHCHINSPELFIEAEDVIQRASDAGVTRILIAGSDFFSSKVAARLSREYKERGVYATVGVHPHDAKTVLGDSLPEELTRLAKNKRVVAIGEAGLDYFYDHSPREVQARVFALQIEWALKIGKPLVIHIREAKPKDAKGMSAMEDALKLLRDTSHGSLMFHCYAGGLKYLPIINELDAYISIGGPVTWTKSDELRQVAAKVPEDRLLCETDSPYLAPKPHRGKINEPAFVRYVYEAIAEARGVDIDYLARAVAENAKRLFGW
ncbi:TatD family hydrolase [Synergistales bacterium]|nr:TatD family hydrolase [Synergistales bacterium]